MSADRQTIRFTPANAEALDREKEQTGHSLNQIMNDLVREAIMQRRLGTARKVGRGRK